MNYTNEKSAVFTGHRCIPTCEYLNLREMLRRIIQNAYNYKGIRNFYCGMALGFDMLCAEMLLELKSELPSIHLTAVVPFKKQSERYSPTNMARYNRLLERADKVVVLNEQYHERCYLERNDYMLEHSSIVIAYYCETRRGGTYYTCKKAREKGLSVINLCLSIN